MKRKTDKLTPVHPGEILSEEFMTPLGLTSSAVAKAIGVTPARVNDIVLQRRGITADTALRLGRFFNVDPQSWINLQKNYELQCAEAEIGDKLAAIQPLKVAA